MTLAGARWQQRLEQLHVPQRRRAALLTPEKPFQNGGGVNTDPAFCAAWRVPPCPADCIRMVATGQALTREEGQAAAGRARRCFLTRNERLKREREQRVARLAASREQHAGDRKRATIQKAIARARARLQQRG